MNETGHVFGIDFTTRLRRRLLVVTLYLSFGAVLAPFWLAHVMAKELLALALPGFLVWAGCFWALSQVTRAFAYPSGRRMAERADERQAQVRDRAFARAYQILSAVFCLCMLYAMLAHDFGWWRPDGAALQGVLFGAILLSATLQSAVVAWMEPDRIEAEEGPVGFGSRV